MKLTTRTSNIKQTHDWGIVNHYVPWNGCRSIAVHNRCKTPEAQRMAARTRMTPLATLTWPSSTWFAPSWWPRRHATRSDGRSWSKSPNLDIFHIETRAWNMFWTFEISFQACGSAKDSWVLALARAEGFQGTCPSTGKCTEEKHSDHLAKRICAAFNRNSFQIFESNSFKVSKLLRRFVAMVRAFQRLQLLRQQLTRSVASGEHFLDVNGRKLSLGFKNLQGGYGSQLMLVGSNRLGFCEAVNKGAWRVKEAMKKSGFSVPSCSLQRSFTLGMWWFVGMWRKALQWFVCLAPWAQQKQTLPFNWRDCHPPWVSWPLILEDMASSLAERSDLLWTNNEKEMTLTHILKKEQQCTMYQKRSNMNQITFLQIQ